MENIEKGFNILCDEDYFPEIEMELFKLEFTKRPCFSWIDLKTPVRHQKYKIEEYNGYYYVVTN